MNKEELARKWMDFTIIKSISFETDFESEYFDCSLNIVLHKTEDIKSESIRINFYGVSNLKISEIGGGISQFVRLDLVIIKDKQWENLNYQVFDYEGDNISFLCRDFEIIK